MVLASKGVTMDLKNMLGDTLARAIAQGFVRVVNGKPQLTQAGIDIAKGAVKNHAQCRVCGEALTLGSSVLRINGNGSIQPPFPAFVHDKPACASKVTNPVQHMRLPAAGA